MRRWSGLVLAWVLAGPLAAQAPQDTVVLVLAPGYNLVSWHVVVANDSIAAIVRPIKDNLKIVTCFETASLRPSGGATGAKLYNPTLPSTLSTLKRTDPRLAYGVYMHAADTLVLIGTPLAPDTPIPVAAGFNLVGYLPAWPDSTRTATLSLQPNLRFVTGFQATFANPGQPVVGGTMYLPGVAPRFNTLKTMTPGSGYWIRVTAADTLVYPTLSRL